LGKITPHDIEVLVDLFDRSDWKELHLETGGVEIYLSKDPAGKRIQAEANVAAPAALQASQTVAAPAAATAQSGAGGATHIADVPMGWTVVLAPSLGTFYRAPKPGAEPFVHVGQAVTAETEMCLVEVMKLFTTVRAGVSGTVREVYAKDGQLVEFDQPLFLVQPDD
jgi:acetyl-CoA carboxylase biotin carboxyl carrier protein